jgi:2-octaprenyl-6-methoxyphenol hydroxylase
MAEKVANELERSCASMTIKTEVAIAGGGLVGMTLGIALAQAGISVTVIDQLPPATVLEPAFDGRASAIAFASRRMFHALGLDPELDGVVQPIAQIMVSDGDLMNGAAPFFLHFDHAEVGHVPLGEMIENRHTRFALHKGASRTPGLTLIAPAKVSAVETNTRAATLTLSTGQKIEAALVVAADGRDSPLRVQMGIRNAAWSYDQTAIVATIAHERPHEGVAHELFLPAGPFAILPLIGNRSSIVWTERRAAAPAFMRLNDQDFIAEVAKRFGDHWGALSLEGPRFSYPLSLQLAADYVAERFVLAGDAAHGVHPIAGQGLNLGLRDVAALAETIVDAARLGQDIGSAPVLERYRRWRAFDNTALAGVMDGLNRLFSNDIKPVRALRTLGLGLVNEIGPLRRLFMRQAGGDLGDLPRLLRGERV